MIEECKDEKIFVYFFMIMIMRIYDIKIFLES